MPTVPGAAAALVVGVQSPQRPQDCLGDGSAPALPELSECVGSAPLRGDEALAVVGDEFEGSVAGADLPGEEDLRDEVHGDHVDARIRVSQPDLGWRLEPRPLGDTDYAAAEDPRESSPLRSLSEEPAEIRAEGLVEPVHDRVDLDALLGEAAGEGLGPLGRVVDEAVGDDDVARVEEPVRRPAEGGADDLPHAGLHEYVEDPLGGAVGRSVPDLRRDAVEGDEEKLGAADRCLGEGNRRAEGGLDLDVVGDDLDAFEATGEA